MLTTRLPLAMPADHKHPHIPDTPKNLTRILWNSSPGIITQFNVHILSTPPGQSVESIYYQSAQHVLASPDFWAILWWIFLQKCNKYKNCAQRLSIQNNLFLSAQLASMLIIQLTQFP